MSFSFSLLSLLLIFLLVMIYYSKSDTFIKGNKVYRVLLLVTYIFELISAFVYMMVNGGTIISVVLNIYLYLIVLWFSLLSLYYIDILLKELRLTKYMNSINICFGIIQIFSLVMLLGSNIDIYNIMGCTNIIYLFSYLFLGINLIVLIFGFKRIKRNTYLSLIAILLMGVLTTYLQSVSPELQIINIGLILIMYYSYFSLENTYQYEIYNLTLERDNAKKNNIDKVAFLKVLSHEIRTPLNTIDGFSQIIDSSDNVEEIKNDVKDIRIASKDLIDVINGMIDLEIIESGNLEIIKENYNVYDMFDDISGIIKSKMKDKDVEYQMELDNDIPEVLLGDSERISQVILNLLTNAIKYTEQGSIILKVDSVKSSNKCRLIITVSDTGSGIETKDMAGIFDIDINKENTKVGLAVSKYLVELMGGSIKVENTSKEGTIFNVTIDQEIVNIDKNEKVSRRRALKLFDASNRRVLLVDDNKLNLKVATKLLGAYKIEVVSCNSGQECLDIIDKDTNFDLILMDDLMPEMSGTECLDILKKIERVDGFYIPVVVLTANAISGMKEKYLNAGFEDYLAKPIDKYELDRIIKKYLKGKK